MDFLYAGIQLLAKVSQKNNYSANKSLVTCWFVIKWNEIIVVNFDIKAYFSWKAYGYTICVMGHIYPLASLCHSCQFHVMTYNQNDWQINCWVLSCHWCYTSWAHAQSSLPWTDSCLFASVLRSIFNSDLGSIVVCLALSLNNLSNR